MHDKDFTKYFFYVLLSFSLISLVGLFSSESGSQHVFFNAQVTGSVITGMIEAGPTGGEIDLPMRNPSVDGVDNDNVLDEIERTKISDDSVDDLKKEVEKISSLPEGISVSENEEVKKALTEAARVPQKSEKPKDEVSIGEMSGFFTNFWLWLKSIFVNVPKEKVLVGKDGSNARVSRDLSEKMDEFNADSVLFMDLEGKVNSYSADGGEGKGNALLVVDGLDKNFVSTGGEISLVDNEGEFLSLVPDFESNVGYALVKDASSVENVAVLKGNKLVNFGRKSGGDKSGKDGLPALGVVRLSPGGELVVNTNDKAFDKGDKAKVVIAGNHQGGELVIGGNKVKVDPGQKELIVCLEESKSAVLVGSSGLLGITGMGVKKDAQGKPIEEIVPIDKGSTQVGDSINVGEAKINDPKCKELLDKLSRIPSLRERLIRDVKNSKELKMYLKDVDSLEQEYKEEYRSKCPPKQPCDTTVPRDEVKNGLKIGGDLKSGKGKIGGDDFGKDYSCVTKLNLKDGETQFVNIGGRDYEVTVNILDNTVIITINGERVTLKERETKQLSETNVGVDNIFSGKKINDLNQVDIFIVIKDCRNKKPTKDDGSGKKGDGKGDVVIPGGPGGLRLGPDGGESDCTKIACDVNIAYLPENNPCKNCGSCKPDGGETDEEREKGPNPGHCSIKEQAKLFTLPPETCQVIDMSNTNAVFNIIGGSSGSSLFTGNLITGFAPQDSGLLFTDSGSSAKLPISKPSPPCGTKQVNDLKKAFDSSKEFYNNAEKDMAKYLTDLLRQRPRPDCNLPPKDRDLSKFLDFRAVNTCDDFLPLGSDECKNIVNNMPCDSFLYSQSGKSVDTTKKVLEMFGTSSVSKGNIGNICKGGFKQSQIAQLKKDCHNTWNKIKDEFTKQVNAEFEKYCGGKESPSDQSKSCCICLSDSKGAIVDDNSGKVTGLDKNYISKAKNGNPVIFDLMGGDTNQACAKICKEEGASAAVNQEGQSCSEIFQPTAKCILRSEPGTSGTPKRREPAPQPPSGYGYIPGGSTGGDKTSSGTGSSYGYLPGSGSTTGVSPTPPSTGKTPEQQCAEVGGSMYEGACVKCPANSAMSGGSCKCSSGYIGQGGQCVACSSYCSSQGLTEPLHSDPPNLKPCYESVSISKKVSQECSCAKTTVTYGNYPSYCTGTPCGSVECNKQASCTVGTTQYTVSCAFGGYGGSGGGQSQASVTTTTTGTGSGTTSGTGDSGGSSPGYSGGTV